MARIRMLTCGWTAVAALLVCAPPARPTEPEGAPSCEELPLVARVGSERQYELWCGRLEDVRVVRAPAHGTLTRLAHDAASRLRFSFRPHADIREPVLDVVTVELAGPGGTARRNLIVKIVPLGHNTPPWCLPEGWGGWSDGTAPAEVQFRGVCQDDEQDAITLAGDGPGTFLAVPQPRAAGIPPLSPGWFRYRASVLQGVETARFVAVDELGARSTHGITYSFGPQGDRPPGCSTPSTTIRVRVGVPRRFPVRCEYAEHDSINVTVLGHPLWHPWRYGDGRPFDDPGPRRSSTYDVVYTPIPGRMEDDPATFVAFGSTGGSEPLHLVMRPQPPSANVPGTCHTRGSVAATQQNSPVEVVLSCLDEDGDVLSASVLSPPRQGSVSPPVVSTGSWDTQELRLTWTPDPAREGRDAVVLGVRDGYGGVTEVTQELEAYGPSYLRLPPPAFLPGLHRPPPPALPTPARPPAPPADPPAGAVPTLADGARAALGTADVRLYRRVGPARLYVPGTAVDLGLAARRPVLWPLAVACPGACSVRVQSWTSGTAPRTQTVALPPRTARALSLRLSAAQRRAIRRARGDAASFRITVTPAGGPAVTGRMAVRLRP